MNRARARSLFVFAFRAPHPFERPSLPSVSEEEPPCLSTLRCLGLPHGSRRPRWEDASHRLLQPTLNTSTRCSTDSRARGLRHDDRVDDELQSVSPSAISMRGVQTALRQSEPQVDQRLTTSLQLRTVRPHLDLVIEVRDELCSKAALSLRGVFSRAQIRRSDL